ncbi:type IV pilus biogenesis/stability protein PilW [Litchfieldella rifensis]|uniref:Type IV pilus biogenesis/stability protein PilW n=1 Tax=Litchfieldella rifensis TaxID=762643 RepID=A0ABV7LKC9_9GAMM
MIRRYCLPVSLTPAAVMVALLSAAWLSGCASQPSSSESEADPADAYTQLGTAYLERDNLPRAISALDRALEIDPDDAEALQAMAMVYQRQEENDLADKYFRRALRIDSGFTRARNNYAAFLFDQGRTAEACRQLEQATGDTQYRNRALLFANLGQCQRELGDLDAARRSLERAQDIAPRSPRSYFTLAEIEYSQGNYSRAWDQLQSFIRLAGITPESKRLASAIAAARGDDDTAAFFSEQLGSSRGAP